MGALGRLPRLVGREDEARCLQETFDRTIAGRSSIFLIEGEAGIGKTRLMQNAIAAARGRRIQVLVGRGRELERTRPFGLVADALGCVRSSADHRRAEIAELLATHGDDASGPISVTSDPGLRFRVVDACADLLEELALAGPVVLALDDLQWADASSLLTLDAFARRLSDLPFALLACLRPSPRTEELAQLVAALHAAGAIHLDLGPLSDPEVRQLAMDVIAAEPGTALLAALAGTAGNPLFITELIAALIQASAITTVDGRAELAEAPLPPTLRLTIIHRLSYLPDTTLGVLRAASVLGSTFSLVDLAAVTSQPIWELSGALAPAMTARVVTDDENNLRFRHDLIRDSIYEDLAVSVRRGLHREVGERLASSGASALVVAEHLARGAEAGDVLAVTWLTRAARDIAPSSSGIAAELLERAAFLIGPTTGERDRILRERARHLMNAGRVPEALTACRELLDRPHDAAVHNELRISCAHALLAVGRVRDALAELDDLVQYPLSLSGADRASALAWAGFARLSLGDLHGATMRAEEARAIAAEQDAHYAFSVGMVTLAAVAETRGHLSDALCIIDEAVARADHTAHKEGHRYPIHITRGHILLELDRVDDARSALQEGMRLSEEFGVRWPLASYSAYRALAEFVAGRWDDAIAEIDAGMELASDTAETYSSVLAHTLLCMIRLHRNDLAGAEEAAHEAVLADRGGSFRSVWAQQAYALVLEARGDVREALSTMSHCWERCTQTGSVLEYRLLGPDLVRISLACDERAMARDVVAAVGKLATHNPSLGSMTGVALRCQGLADGDAETLQQAVDAFSRGSRPLELALTCEDAATAFARRGEPDRARPMLLHASEIYERLSAARDRARIEATGREVGIRRGTRGPQNRLRTGWDSLTPTEASIATLVAAGLSNPQIGERLYISRRTVQAHLAHIFPKLGIASRAQLAAEAVRHQAE